MDVSIKKRVHNPHFPCDHKVPGASHQDLPTMAAFICGECGKTVSYEEAESEREEIDP